MNKCDFCTQSDEKGKCFWNFQSARETDCEKAIKKMTEAIKGMENKEKRLFG